MTVIMLLGLAAVLMLLAGGLRLILRARSARIPSWEEVQAAAEDGGYRLINTGELAALDRDETVRALLVDTRVAGEYRGGHIPGAVNFPLTPTWWGKLWAYRSLARLLGPDQGLSVVFY